MRIHYATPFKIPMGSSPHTWVGFQLSADRVEVGYHPILNVRRISYLSSIKNHKIVTRTALCALALSSLLIGCDRQVSSEKTSEVSRDGTVKSKEKSVTKSPDGTVTKKEESKKTTPPEKP